MQPHEDVAAFQTALEAALAAYDARSDDPNAALVASGQVSQHDVDRVRSYYRTTPPWTDEDQERLQKELDPPDVELRYRGRALVGVRVLAKEPRRHVVEHRPRQGRAPRSRRRVTRSRARSPGGLDEGDEPELDAPEPETAWEFDQRLEIHDRIVAAKLELDLLDADLVDVPLTILRGLIEELEAALGARP